VLCGVSAKAKGVSHNLMDFVSMAMAEGEPVPGVVYSLKEAIDWGATRARRV